MGRTDELGGELKGARRGLLCRLDKNPGIFKEDASTMSYTAKHHTNLS